MKTTKYSTLITLYKIMEKYKRYWTYGSQQNILRLLKQIHGVTIQRRMLCYHLADLRESGLIKTIRRHNRKDDGTLVLLTSAHCITLKGYLYLARMGVAGVWKRISELRRRYAPILTKRTRVDEPLTDQITPQPKSGFNPFLDPLWRKRHGFIERFEDLEKNGSHD